MEGGLTVGAHKKSALTNGALMVGAVVAGALSDYSRDDAQQGVFSH